MKRILLFSLFLSTMLYAADKKPNFAVTDFCGTSWIDSTQGAVLAERFQAELLNTGAFQVLDRKQMESILREQGFQQSGACSGEECTVKMGQLLQVYLTL